MGELKDSLAQLRTDYVDMFLIHWPTGLKVDLRVQCTFKEFFYLLLETLIASIFKRFLRIFRFYLVFRLCVEIVDCSLILL